MLHDQRNIPQLPNTSPVQKVVLESAFFFPLLNWMRDIVAEVDGVCMVRIAICTEVKHTFACANCIE